MLTAHINDHAARLRSFELAGDAFGEINEARHPNATPAHPRGMRANLNGAMTLTDPTGTWVRQTLAYHERTKHHLYRYARGPGHLDWATQPDPFRTFAGAPAVELPLLAHELSTLYGDLYVPGAVEPRALGR